MALDAEKLEEVGKVLYGDVWQTNLARELGIGSRLVRQWLAGERIMHYKYYQKIVDILNQKEKDIGEVLISLEDYRSQIDHCRLAKDIDFLCCALNEYEADFDPELGKPQDFLDYSNLPVFSEFAPSEVEGVFSYSDDYLMIKEDKWVLVPRIEKR